MLSPKKSLGQNFLKDKNIANKIINLIENYDKKNIIEIGPGKGALTDIIVNKKPKNLILVEKDKFLFNDLVIKHKNNKSIKVYNDDALEFNFLNIKKPKSIIANLPYNISIKLIINWLKIVNEFNEIILMIQREVANKMDYRNTNKLNRLNILTSITSNYQIKFDVSKNVFFPKPKVVSSVIKITPKTKIKYSFSKLENFTRILFQHKRKKLKNVLPKDILKMINNNGNHYKIKNLLDSRAEDLDIKEIIILFKLF